MLSQFWTSPLFHIWFKLLLLDLQISQEAGQVVWYSHLLKRWRSHSLLWSTNSKALVNVAEVNVFLESPCFFYDPRDVGNLISCSSAFSKSSLNTWKFSVFVLFKPSLEDFEHYFVSMWNVCGCAIVWTFSYIALLQYWSKNWPFKSHGHC